MRLRPVSTTPLRAAPAGRDRDRCLPDTLEKLTTYHQGLVLATGQSGCGKTATLAALLGPAIGIGSLGLYRLIAVHSDSVGAGLGALSNNIAGALFAAMALIQLAVRSSDADGQKLVRVWLGLDVAWDVYIGIGTVCFALAMIRHPRFGWIFAVSGLVIGMLVLVLNLATFPTPPADAGLVDVGPVVGLWYLAATIQAWRSLGWVRTRYRDSVST